MRIAIYMRLSKEDGNDDSESNSIINQRLLLQQYAAGHFEDYTLQEFQDDGFSGLNFNRPGIVKLLKAAEDGEIDCIIVKDFSRFSRDYIEMGNCLERFFPKLGVRFISVNDSYDSEYRMGSSSGLDTAFKSLLYDLYSKDLSVKVKASLRTKKEQGQYVSGTCPFGYRKSPKDRHMLLIDEEEAAVVKRIFRMTAEGRNSAEIAECFNREGVKTPIQFRIEKQGIKRQPKGGRFVWSRSTVCAILRNPVYTGDIVYGKYTRYEVGGKNHLKPKCKWKTHHGHHEAIIERDFFEMIQKRKKSRQ